MVVMRYVTKRPCLVQQIVSWRRICGYIVLGKRRSFPQLWSICSIYYWPIPRTHLMLIICERERIYKGSWLSLWIPIQIASTSELVSSNTHIIKSKKSSKSGTLQNSCDIMKLFTISTICALLATITHAIPGPLVPAPDVPAPALPAPIIEARQSAIPFAFLILIGTNNVGISTQISTTNVFVQICTYFCHTASHIFILNFSELFILSTFAVSFQHTHTHTHTHIPNNYANEFEIT